MAIHIGINSIVVYSSSKGILSCDSTLYNLPYIIINYIHYSGTSNKSPSEKGTTSLQRKGHVPYSEKYIILYTCTLYAIHFQHAKRGTKWLLVPKCTLLGGSTVLPFTSIIVI